MKLFISFFLNFFSFSYYFLALSHLFLLYKICATMDGIKDCAFFQAPEDEGEKMEGEEGDSIKIAMDQYYQDEFNDQYDEGRKFLYST